MVFHVDSEDFIKEVLKVVIAQSFEYFFDVLSDSQFKPPLFITQNRFKHGNQVLEGILFSNYCMQLWDALDNVDSH